MGIKDSIVCRERRMTLANRSRRSERQKIHRFVLSNPLTRFTLQHRMQIYLPPHLHELKIIKMQQTLSNKAICRNPIQNQKLLLGSQGMIWTPPIFLRAGEGLVEGERKVPISRGPNMSKRPKTQTRTAGRLCLYIIQCTLWHVEYYVWQRRSACSWNWSKTDCFELDKSIDTIDYCANSAQKINIYCRSYHRRR